MTFDYEFKDSTGKINDILLEVTISHDYDYNERYHFTDIEEAKVLSDETPELIKEFSEAVQYDDQLINDLITMCND